MKKWIKKGSANSVSEVCLANYTGTALTQDPLPPDQIQNMRAFADALIENLEKEMLIVGDYDVDGIAATTILTELLWMLGGNPASYLPHRFTDGYGVPTSVIENTDAEVLITVDNGVRANEAISVAKRTGMKVFVLDHHLPGKTLPDADVILDPHIDPDNNGCAEYCGAGLALKLCEMIFPSPMHEEAIFMKRATVLAAIATVADVMPLIDDNRRIVKHGLHLIGTERNILSAGLRALLAHVGTHVTESELAFKIVPMLNAPGRMFDAGASMSLNLLLTEDNTAERKAAYLSEVNKRRKVEVENALLTAEQIIVDEGLLSDVPLCVYIPNICEGIVGILTGKLAEKYNVPAFCFTDGEDKTVLKGSGRSVEGVDLLSVVEAAKDKLLKYGGHTGAAGLSVTRENYSEAVLLMQDAMRGYENNAEETSLYYDLEIGVEDIPCVYKELQVYAPFGAGNPAPVFLVRNVVLSPRNGTHFKIMKEKHLKLYAKGFSATAFNNASQYLASGEPVLVDMVGTLKLNVFMNTRELSMELSDWQPGESHVTRSPLLEALKQNGVL